MDRIIADALQRLADLCEVKVERLDTEEGVLKALNDMAYFVYELKGNIEQAKSREIKLAGQRNSIMRALRDIISIANKINSAHSILQVEVMNVQGVVGAPVAPAVAPAITPIQAEVEEQGGDVYDRL